MYLATKLLLKLSDKLEVNLAEGFPKSVRNMNDHSLSVSRDIDLPKITTTKKVINSCKQNRINKIPTHVALLM